ncbi:group II intron maturase-specific domain-containing protein [uncultured Sutterella sp.]|uniref:group II intron maturase-specific domain-containing protein n=1 Tax=uncultured Sutterella sp. TaxID=286133 RepID=UPI00259AF302|nr:group II intron maturase-specific domain-containing protein [uncultured Sutterella sp.]
MRVNRDKSGVFRPGRAKFLGYTFWCRKPIAHPKSINRLKQKLKDVFFRARGSSLLSTIKRLNMILRGWRNYFQLDLRRSVYYELDCHIRRHLRKLVWLAWKRPKRRMAALIKLGIPTAEARKAAGVGSGAWRMSGTKTMHKAYPLDFFRRNKLYSLLEMK